MKESNSINTQIDSLRTTRSAEFNKPKSTNLKHNQHGVLVDSRTPRDEELIKECTSKINELKLSL